jgi:hypothetical protein
MALAITAIKLSPVAFSQRPAVRQGLLMLEGDGPLSENSLRVAPQFLSRLVAQELPEPWQKGMRFRPNQGLGLGGIVINATQRDYLQRWAASLRARARVPPLVLVGPPGSGRATTAHAACSSAGRGLLEVFWAIEHPDQLQTGAREALWQDAVLLVRVADTARDADMLGLWAELESWPLPISLALTRPSVEAACAAAPCEPAVLYLEETTIAQRELLWERLLAAVGPTPCVSLSDTERNLLATRYEFPPARLARAIRRAVAEHTLCGESRPLDFEALSQACRAVGTANMGSIAQRLPQPFTRDDLVLPQALLDELDLASAWMRNRRIVFDDWGFSRRIALGRGLTALFTGEPGTGKTMAAQVLARELGLELFRVDLSRVMSKYIGETAKHLSQLFDDARMTGAILFFDEADALFGKRTEVKDAHDRYANLEIGYLLQRMEEHSGTTVLATNRMRDLDEAFTRRFHFILDFPMPRAPERRRIWEGMLPPDARREPGLDLDGLARDYEVSGGDIRNSVLSAAFTAANEGVPIGIGHLKRGLRRELLKTGRVLDRRQRRELD